MVRVTTMQQDQWIDRSCYAGMSSYIQGVITTTVSMITLQSISFGMVHHQRMRRARKQSLVIMLVLSLSFACQHHAIQPITRARVSTQ